MSDQEKVRALLSEQQFMVVAVVLPDGTPWAVPVKIQTQDGRAYEWESKLTTEHSRAIALKQDVAITIFDKRPDIQTGIYMQATAELVEEKPKQMGRYRATATRLWLNDETFVKREVELT